MVVGCAKAPPAAPVEKPIEVVEEEADDTDVAPDVAIDMPELPADASCRQARAAYHDAWALAGAQRADLTNGQYGSVLARNRYFQSCRVPSRFEIKICAAVQNGEVQGATVRLSPRAPSYERCIEQGVRKLSFPSHPRMDVTTTTFASN